MKKRQNSKKIEEKDIHKSQRLDLSAQKHKNEEEWIDVLHSTQRNMSEGALNIFRIQRTRSHWGNKKLWGHKDKGRNKPGRSVPKTHPASKKSKG